MNFLLDQGLPRSTVTHLKNIGLNAQHVGQLGMATALDKEILDKARQDNFIVVTLDSDFHSLLALDSNGDFDYIESASEVYEADFFRFIKVRTILDKLAQTYLSRPIGK